MALQAQTTTLPVIGFLNSASEGGFEPCIAAFHQGLKETGYVVGQNVEIAYSWANGKYGELRQRADDLVGQQVSVIAATGGVTPARAAKAATSTIPIVFACGFDPADHRVGLVASLANPGGNATGVNVFNTELLPQRRELLSELAGTTNIALLLNPEIFLAQIGIEQGKVSGTPVLNASTEVELDKQFAAAQAAAYAVLVDADSFFTSRRNLIVALAKKYRVPTSYPWREYAEAGGLMSYGASFTNSYRQIGVYTGMVLKGANTAAMQVLQPTSFELVINLGAARDIGLEVPLALLARADKVIE